MAGALAVAALNGVSGLLGAWSGIGALAPARPTRPRAAAAFWLLLRVGQGSALTLAIGGRLAGRGRQASSSEHLFYLYALLPLAVAFVAEQLRVASAQTILDQRGSRSQAVGTLPEAEQHVVVASCAARSGVMALSALVVVFLALRAAGTAHRSRLRQGATRVRSPARLSRAPRG